MPEFDYNSISEMERLATKPNRTPSEEAELRNWVAACPLSKDKGTQRMIMQGDQPQARSAAPTSVASAQSLISVRTTDTPLTALGSIDIADLHREMDAEQERWRDYGTFLVPPPFPCTDLTISFNCRVSRSSCSSPPDGCPVRGPDSDPCSP